MKKNLSAELERLLMSLDQLYEEAGEDGVSVEILTDIEFAIDYINSALAKTKG